MHAGKTANLVRTMKPAAIQKLNEQLLEKTGVDFSRYRNDELSDTLANAISFPLFFVRSLTRPVGLLLILTALAAWFAESGYFKSFLVFPGLLLAIVNGVLLGLVLFIRRIRDDMTRIFTISSDLCVQALRDISTARRKLSGKPGGFPGLAEIFHGMNAVVILPMVVQILRRKIPFAGGLAASVTERFFNVFDRRMSASFEQPERVLQTPGDQAEAEQVAGWLQSAERVIHSARENISKVVRAVSRVVSFPFITVFALVFVLSAALLYLGYTLLG